ncbi:DMT family transporter [uncultured Roseibium sp.]|uniref:DMT family transporter n=1 Tax=uncultured Roseibium sp. TaxID=1936171 RepID=UPI002624F642|nr:DMT family transporter [uncultured Roseibium sp.]
MSRSYLIALFLGVVAAFLLGMNSVSVRFLTSDLHGLQIAVFRLWIGCTTIFALLMLSGYRFRLFPYDRYQCLAIAGFTLNYITFHIGLEKTSATNAMVLENTAPFFVLLILVATKVERVRWSDGVATMMALAGVYLTVRQDLEVGANGLEGDIWEIGAGISWAMFIVGSAASVKKTRSSMDRMAVLLKILLPCGLVLTPSLFLFPLQVTTVDISVLLALGVFSTALCYYLWYEAMSEVSTVTASLLIALSVVFAFVAAFFLLGETITLDMLIGATLIVVAVVLPGLVDTFTTNAKAETPD